MIHSVSPFTKKQFKNYKGMEAYSFFESGFVHVGAICYAVLNITESTESVISSTYLF